jgi:histidinol phosphatase-like enzyme (inositol monophosphatase family)
VSSTSDPATLLQAALELATLTGSTALPHFRRELAVETKQDGSPVTIADRDAERRARDWLARRFPEDGVIGEEFGSSPGRSGRTWLLDPIDGTKSFVRGVPLWGSLVALVERDTVLAGAAAFPAVGEHLGAARGAGCWHNGARCRVNPQSDLACATALTSDVERFSTPTARRAWGALAAAVTVTRTWGDCYGYLLVATGRAELMVDVGLNPWDIACFVPIIEEAGGRITDFEGASYPPLESAIATNAALADAVRRIWNGAAR